MILYGVNRFSIIYAADCTTKCDYLFVQVARYEILIEQLKFRPHGLHVL